MGLDPIKSAMGENNPLDRKDRIVFSPTASNLILIPLSIISLLHRPAVNLSLF